MIVPANGQSKRREEAVISVSDHGFLYGMGLFETFRTCGGRPRRVRMKSFQSINHVLGKRKLADGGTASETVPVTRMEDKEGKPLRSGGRGPVTRRWMEEYRRMAEKGELR